MNSDRFNKYQKMLVPLVPLVPQPEKPCAIRVLADLDTGQIQKTDLSHVSHPVLNGTNGTTGQNQLVPLPTLKKSNNDAGFKPMGQKGQAGQAKQ